jgi:hypothetical protein
MVLDSDYAVTNGLNINLEFLAVNEARSDDHSYAVVLPLFIITILPKYFNLDYFTT